MRLKYGNAFSFFGKLISFLSRVIFGTSASDCIEELVRFLCQKSFHFFSNFCFALSFLFNDEKYKRKCSILFVKVFYELNFTNDDLMTCIIPSCIALKHTEFSNATDRIEEACTLAFLGIGCHLGTVLANPLFLKPLGKLVEGVAAKMDSKNQKNADNEFESACTESILPAELTPENWHFKFDELALGTAFDKSMTVEYSTSKESPSQCPFSVCKFTDCFLKQAKFVNFLVDLSCRLGYIIKSDRQAFLISELEVFNQNLPTDLCIPLVCSPSCDFNAVATENNKSSSHTNSLLFEHQTMLRIIPKESILLNSAERVPFMIFVEVLERESFEVMQDLSLKLATAKQASCMSLNEKKALSQTNPEKSLSVVRESNWEKINDAQLAAAVEMLSKLNQAPGNEEIKQKLTVEIQTLRKNTDSYVKQKESVSVEDELRESVSSITFKDDPSTTGLSEAWSTRMKRLRVNSEFSCVEGWNVYSFVVKGNTDLKQEQIALQLIWECRRIFAAEKVECWLRFYRVFVTSNGGLIETLPNTLSVHSIKKLASACGASKKILSYSIFDYFIEKFGSPSSESFQTAAYNFFVSLTGYCLYCYLFQLKDRHNGNILIDDAGHIIHIDFGFILSHSPGSIVDFESAPFKLSYDWVQIVEHLNGSSIESMKQLFIEGLLAIRKHHQSLFILLEIAGKGILS